MDTRSGARKDVDTPRWDVDDNWHHGGPGYQVTQQQGGHGGPGYQVTQQQGGQGGLTQQGASGAPGVAGVAGGVKK